MAKVFAEDGEGFPSSIAAPAHQNAIDGRETTAPERADPDPGVFGDTRAATHVPAALRFAPPPEPEPSRERALWPTPFGRPANDVPFRVVAEHVGASYPAPPPEERGLPRYAERNEGRKKGLASLAFARSVGTGAVGAAGFGLGAGGGHAPDPRALRMNEGVETLGLGPCPRLPGVPGDPAARGDAREAGRLRGRRRARRPRHRRGCFRVRGRVIRVIGARGDVPKTRLGFEARGDCERRGGPRGAEPRGGHTRGPRPGGGRGGVRAAAGTGRTRRDARDARARHVGVADHEPERARLDGVRLIPRARRGRLLGA